MKFKDYPFGALPFSSLFRTYTSDFEKVSQFYETDPFDIHSVKNRAESFEFKGNREEAVEFLLQFNRQFGVDEKAITNIKKLKLSDALALVTGQQLGLFGGPVYTFYKIITVIHLSRRLEEQLKQPVIPVFWPADEDHDFDEVRTVQGLTGKGVKAFSLVENNTNRPVSEIEFPPQLSELKKALKIALIDTDFSDNLWKLIDDCFKPEETFLKGFGTFISRLFSKHGLVLAGSNNTKAKQLTKQCLIKSVEQSDAVYEALKEQSNKLQEAYHQQVTLYNSHLFYLSESSGRMKINRGDTGWHTENGKRWSKGELLNEIDNQSRKFSPDVFLRPVVQDKLLPTLGYIGGPGEVAYYGQMKSFYNVFDMKMPVIFPRLSATFIEPAIVRIFRELPFEVKDYQKRIEDLETEYAKKCENINIETLFADWKKGIKDLEVFYSKPVKKIDETLAGTSKKAQAQYFNELDKLKGKTYQAVKKNEEIQIKRIRRIQRHLFPERNLQERTISGIYYMNKFGIDIWDRLLEQLNDEESYRKHKLIYL